MKKILFSLTALITTNISIAQIGRYERSYDVIGLSNADEVLDSVIIAIPLILLGFIISYAFMWSKKAQQKENGKGQSIGCIGIIIMCVGVCFLFPLLTWIEFIAMSVWSVVHIIIIVILILVLIFK